MPSFALVPEVVPLLCQALMAGLAAGYLLSIRRRTRSTRWLTILFVATAGFALSYLLAMSFPTSAEWSLRFSMGLYVGVGVAGFAGLRLAYTFLARPFRREERVVSTAAALGLAGLVGATVAAQVTLVEGLFAPLLYAYGAYLLVVSLVALTVHLRQAARFSRLSTMGLRSSARRASAQGHRAMAGLTVVTVVLAVINALSTVGALTPLAIQYSSLLLELVIVVGLVVVFINHAPEPSTVQAKLVGITLGVVLALLGLTSMALLRPVELAQAAGNETPEAITVRFQADGDGGYAVSRDLDAGRVDLAPEGEPLAEAGPLELPFAFPIGGGRYREVSVTRLPYLAFDKLGPCTLVCIGAAARPNPDHPLILPFALPPDIDALEPPRVAATPDRVDVRWHVRGVGGQEAEHRATLWPDGTVEIAYRGPRRHARSGAAGLHPGGGEVMTAAFARDAPATLPAGAALVDPYGERFVAIAGARTARMVGFVVGATIVVILLIPLFLRRGVLDPLSALSAGLERVDKGKRGVRLDAHSNDEMGLLARRFNATMVSLETAEVRLRQYAEALESRVADRTRSLRDAVDALGRQRDALEQSLADLREAQGRLVQAEKMASLGRLTAGIAHELKNPLNFVTNFADLSVELTAEVAEALREESDRPVEDVLGEVQPLLDDLAANAERICEHGRLADRIVRGMMLHARGSQVDHVPSDLNGLLQLAAGGTVGGDGARSVELDLDPAVGTVEVAAEGIVQMAVSLLNNALDATAQAETSTPVVLRSARDGDAVTVQVVDAGTGMDAETEARAFEPFYTTKPPGAGTGLGLSLVYDIVTAGHGGAIDVETAPGEGTTVTVRLPAPRTNSNDAPLGQAPAGATAPVWETAS